MVACHTQPRNQCFHLYLPQLARAGSWQAQFHTSTHPYTAHRFYYKDSGSGSSLCPNHHSLLFQAQLGNGGQGVGGLMAYQQN